MIVVVPTNAAEASTSVSKTVEGKRGEEEEEAGGREVWCRSGDGGEILSRTRSCDAYAASTGNFANLLSHGITFDSLDLLIRSGISSFASFSKN